MSTMIRWGVIKLLMIVRSPRVMISGEWCKYAGVSECYDNFIIEKYYLKTRYEENG